MINRWKSLKFIFSLSLPSLSLSLSLALTDGVLLDAEPVVQQSNIFLVGAMAKVLYIKKAKGTEPATV